MNSLWSLLYSQWSHSTCMAVEHMLISRHSRKDIVLFPTRTVMPKTKSKCRRTSHEPTCCSLRPSTQAATALSSAVSMRPPPAPPSQQHEMQAVTALSSAATLRPPLAPPSQANEPLSKLLELIRSEVCAGIKAQQTALAMDSQTPEIGQPKVSPPAPTRQTQGIYFVTVLL